MHSTAVVGVGLGLGIVCLWALVRMCSAISCRRRKQRAREESGYYTMCQYGPDGPDGTRWIVRRSLPGHRAYFSEAEIPAFLRRQRQDE